MIFRTKLVKYGTLVFSGAIGAGIIYTQCESQQSGQFRYSTTTTPPPAFGKKWDHNWDWRDPFTIYQKRGLKSLADLEESTENLIPIASRHILLIRHGDYHTEAKDFDSKTLTDLGEIQAQATGNYLKTLDLTYSALTCSDMPRAVQTADIIWKALGLGDQENVQKSKSEGQGKEAQCSNSKALVFVQDELLREGSPVLPDPLPMRWESKIGDKELYSFQDSPRIEAACRKYIHRASPDQENDSFELIVCHANVIRYFICRAIQLQPEAWLRISLRHGSITCLTVLPNGGVILRSVNEIGHLPPNLIENYF